MPWFTAETDAEGKQIFWEDNSLISSSEEFKG